MRYVILVAHRREPHVRRHIDDTGRGFLQPSMEVGRAFSGHLCPSPQHDRAGRTIRGLAREAAGGNYCVRLHDLIAVRRGRARGEELDIVSGGIVKELKPFASLPVFIATGEKDFALGYARDLNRTLIAGGVKNVTFKEYPGIEHLLVVRESLPAAFELFENVAAK